MTVIVLLWYAWIKTVASQLVQASGSTCSLRHEVTCAVHPLKGPCFQDPDLESGFFTAQKSKAVNFTSELGSVNDLTPESTLEILIHGQAYPFSLFPPFYFTKFKL